ncbi:unnamed protein product [Brassica rapa]|uniref:Uncharacterized protein n=1 Tax=Brassica campestris TaxID=3711 RepID=A0A8D9CZ70_BRACM|nr:unnamed protein product [Brassica rapa]
MSSSCGYADELKINLKSSRTMINNVEFPHELSSRTLFASGDSSLTLVSANEKVIYVYALKNILSDPKWVPVKQIRVTHKNGVNWYVEAYNGKCLVLRT